MKRNEPVSKIMTTNPVTVHTKQKPSDVRRAMAENKCHHLPVVSGAKLLGLITASDMLGVSVEGTGADQRSMDAYLDHQFTIETLMAKDLRTLAPNATIREAADALCDGSFHALPVIDDDGELKGIVTSTDLIRHLRDQY